LFLPTNKFNVAPSNSIVGARNFIVSYHSINGQQHLSLTLVTLQFRAQPFLYYYINVWIRDFIWCCGYPCINLQQFGHYLFISVYMLEHGFMPIFHLVDWMPMPSSTHWKTIPRCEDSLAWINWMFRIFDATNFNNDASWSHSWTSPPLHSLVISYIASCN